MRCRREAFTAVLHMVRLETGRAAIIPMFFGAALSVILYDHMRYCCQGRRIACG